MAGRTLIVPESETGRLDAFVRRALPRLSRRVVAGLIAAGAVQLNGRPARKGAAVHTGDCVTVPDTGALTPEPDLPVAVVYADDTLVAIDKPGGMRGHALDPGQRGTAAAFLLGRFPDLATVGTALAPGLVHRLDTGTSGLLLAARTAGAHAAVRAALRARAIEKRYLAVVEGHVAAGDVRRVTTALAHHPRARGRMIPAAAGARAWEAESVVEGLAGGSGRSLVGVTIRTGVTHQVRVHLALLGHPVLGDAVYGTACAALPPGRHALHATALRLVHPAHGTRLELQAPLPSDLEHLLADPTVSR